MIPKRGRGRPPRQAGTVGDSEEEGEALVASTLVDASAGGIDMDDVPPEAIVQDEVSQNIK